jgi:hypothetical protein
VKKKRRPPPTRAPRQTQKKQKLVKRKEATTEFITAKDLDSPKRVIENTIGFWKTYKFGERLREFGNYADDETLGTVMRRQMVHVWQPEMTLIDDPVLFRRAVKRLESRPKTSVLRERVLWVLWMLKQWQFRLAWLFLWAPWERKYND